MFRYGHYWAVKPEGLVPIWDQLVADIQRIPYISDDCQITIKHRQVELFCQELESPQLQV